MKTDWIAGFLGTWSTELTLGAILLRLALSMALAAIIGLMVVAFIWFEYIEKALGLDKRKAHDVDEQRRADRVKKSLEKRR